jgi:polyhydroxyalkanoate synthesis regulator phasin
MKQVCQFLLSIFILMSCNSTSKKIELAVVMQLQRYPESTLQDIYKNFHQDRFGPGHAISNSEEVMQYLERELAAMEEEETPQPIEDIGWEHRFVRIPLAMVKTGKISREDLKELFIASAFEIKPEAGDEWKKEWRQITRIIQKKKLQVNNFEEDKKHIDSLLNENPIIALHHSRAFNEHYHPHYRIIERKLFEAKQAEIIQKNGE